MVVTGSLYSATVRVYDESMWSEDHDWLSNFK